MQWGGLGRGNPFERIKRDTIYISACQKFLKKFTFKFVPQLFKSILTDLEFSECYKIKIEDVIVLFEFDKRPQKFNNTSKCICSSGDFQYFVIKTLNTETISQSRNPVIFFIQYFYKIQYFLFWIGIQFDAQLS